MAALTIDSNYGYVVLPLSTTSNPQLTSKLISYVVLAAVSTFVVNILHSINTGVARKAAKVPYPAAYAPSSRTDAAAHKFNCAQRSHANFSENQPTALASLLLAGLRFPLAAAALGLGWSVSRYFYMTGYSRGDEGGKGRYQGMYFCGFQVLLIGLAGANGVMTVLGM